MPLSCISKTHFARPSSHIMFGLAWQSIRSRNGTEYDCCWESLKFVLSCCSSNPSLPHLTNRSAATSLQQLLARNTSSGSDRHHNHRLHNRRHHNPPLATSTPRPLIPIIATTVSTQVYNSPPRSFYSAIPTASTVLTNPSASRTPSLWIQLLSSRRA